MNIVLKKRQMNPINIEQYRNLFTFPVKNYYESVGFNFGEEDFEIPAMEFIDHYYSQLNQSDLHPYAFEILEFFKRLGFKQLVLSAMEHDNLISSLTDKGIVDFFDDISGINDHYAHSKLEMGVDLMKDSGVNEKEVLMIGDTIHDFEVATGLGVDCILVSNGHQSEERLLKTTPNVISELKEIKSFFNP